MTVSSQFLGRLPYDAGLAKQMSAIHSLQSDTSHRAIVLGLEHEAVITLGVRGDASIDIGDSEENLLLKGVRLHRSERGGQATIHSPGQLVIYPCANLAALGLGPRTFVTMIEQVTKNWLLGLGVEAQTKCPEPGLFVGDAKLVAFGFKIARGFSSHGLAINVQNDLALFDLIRTCGVSGQPVTRLCDLLPARFSSDNLLEALFLSWVDAFTESLGPLRDTILTPGAAAR